MERLRQIADEQNSEYSEYTLMPFGKYAKPPYGPKRLADVPEDYLKWWFEQNDHREIIILEIEHGPYAQRVAAKMKLRLHDYIRRMRKEYDCEIQDHRQSHAA